MGKNIAWKIWKGVTGTKGSSDKKSSISRRNSIRSSMKKIKKRQAKVAWKVNESGCKKVGLIILNKDYSSSYVDLPGVSADGDLMEKMLTFFDEVEIVTNTSDFEQRLKDFSERHETGEVECLHFHYSGHGVDNALVEFDPKKKDGKAFDGVTPSGECMVACDGSLYSIHDLKHELLKCNPKWLTITLDCCRSSNRAACAMETVRLRDKRPISLDDQKKIALIYGTSDLHTARDTNTFTQQLYKVFTDEDEEIPFVDIASKVNQSWLDCGITQQMCKIDVLEVGRSWKFFIWPTGSTAFTIKAKKETQTDSLPAATIETDVQEEMRELTKRMQTLEDEKQASTKTIEKLQKEVSKLSVQDETRKRKRTGIARHGSKKRKTTNVIVFV